jgi:hypothetical protein
MTLATQLYCPLGDSPYHRCLHVFVCCSKTCSKKAAGLFFVVVFLFSFLVCVCVCVCVYVCVCMRAPPGNNTAVCPSVTRLSYDCIIPVRRYVCVLVCMCVCVCVQARKYVCCVCFLACEQECMCKHACISVCMRAFMHVWVCTHICLLFGISIWD